MRNKLIELIREVQYLGGLEEKLADHLLANGVTIQQWIPVSERLPERNGKYMVYASVRGHKYVDCVSFAQDLYRIDPFDFHGRKGKSGFYYDNEYGFGEYGGVTNWMHLPEPPQEEA